MKTTTPPFRWWDLPAASLLMVALLTAATRLVVTQWTDYLTLVQSVAFLGTIAGLALGQSRFPPRLAGFFALAFGAFVVPWQLGMTLGRGILWSERLASMAGRLNIIINQLTHQEVVQDSLLFLVLMSSLFWLLSVYAGYTLTRYGNAWRAILPTGLALFAIHSFDALIPRRAWYLAVFLFFALVLVARMAYLQHRNRWQQSRTALPPHLGLDFIRFTLMAAGVLVIFSWTAPALADTVPAAERAFQKIKQPWNEVRDRLDNAFAPLRSSVGVVSDYYGSSVLLGRGNRLTDTQVIDVKVPTDTPSGVRFYWRARTYDTYENGQWLSTIATSQSFNPQDSQVTLPKEGGRWTGTFEVTAFTYISTLFTPPQPLWISRPAQMERANNPDGTIDVSAFRATPAISPGQIYSTQASLSEATGAQLRTVGSDYPQWIKDRYLQIPNTITPRTRQLAEDIAAGLDNPYDKAVAITNYLRDTIQYSDTVPNKPSGQDAVDWFLFDYRKGFCNYYATAEVVLLRSLGIPARFSVGYAQGERLEDGTYLVRQRDAHAWPEVYFPDLGWVEFEPTASQPVLNRLPGDPANDANANLQSSSAEEELRRQQLEEELALQRQERLLNRATPVQTSPWRRYYWIPTLLLAGGVLWLGWRMRDRINSNLQTLPITLESTMVRVGIRPPDVIRLWARRAALPPLAKAYLEINHALSRLGKRPALTDTPAERATALEQILPEARPPAQQLVAEYELATFSPQPANLPLAREAGSKIRTLSYKAWLRSLIARLQKTSRPARPWLNRKYPYN